MTKMLELVISDGNLVETQVDKKNTHRDNGFWDQNNICLARFFISQLAERAVELKIYVTSIFTNFNKPRLFLFSFFSYHRAELNANKRNFYFKKYKTVCF